MKQGSDTTGAPSTPITGGESVYWALRDLGVTHVFGISSIHNIPIFEAIDRLGHIVHVSCRHEQGAVHAADGYARATGKLGVVVASTGPGTTNTVTGLFEAQTAASPVLLVTGQVPSQFLGQGRGFLHENERQADLLQIVVSDVWAVRDRTEIGMAVRAAGRRAQEGRPSPTAVEIPIDLQYAEQVDEVAADDRPALDDGGSSQAALREVAERLSRSARVIIWAGGGVRDVAAADALAELAARLQSPVVTTINGRGALPWSHPNRLGTITDVAEFWPYLERADVLLAIGTRFQVRATAQWTMPPPRWLIHIDADETIFGRSYAPDQAVTADATAALRFLSSTASSTDRDADFLAEGQQLRDRLEERFRHEAGADYAAIFDILNEHLDADTVVAADNCMAMGIAGRRLLHVQAPRRAIESGTGAIGPGLAFGLGAAVGTGTRSYVLNGDGGIMLSLGELATIAEHRLPLTICVFNDRGYGAIRMVSDLAFGREIASDLLTPDFVVLAQSLGIEAARVHSPTEFAKALEYGASLDGPLLVDVDLTAMESTSPVAWRRRSTAPAPPGMTDASPDTDDRASP